MTAIRRTAGLRLVRSHGQVVTASMMPLRKPNLPVTLAPAREDMARLRTHLATLAIELARDQITANTVALEQLAQASDWAAIIAILHEHGTATAARFAEAVQRQITIVGQAVLPVATGG